MPEGTLLALTTEGIMQLERDVVAELKRRALDQNIAASEAELVVRDILPATDLNAAYEEWTQSGLIAGGAYTTVYSGRLRDTKIFAVYGVCNETPTATSGVAYKTKESAGVSGASPCTVAIRFGLGVGPAKIKDIWHVQKMYEKDEQSVFCDVPVIYNKEEVFQIAFYGRRSVSGGMDAIILHGKVCEPKGEVILGAE